MKGILTLIIGLLSVGTMMAQTTPPVERDLKPIHVEAGIVRLPIGGELPMANQKFLDISGDLVTMNQLKGENGLLVIFSCNTCPFVIAYEDRYPELVAHAKANGIGIVLVNPNEAKRAGDDSYEEMKRHAEAAGYTSHYVVDTKSKFANAVGAFTTPHSFLFDKNNKLFYKGGIDDNWKSKDKVSRHWLKDAMTAVKFGKELRNPITRSKGCSIKRVFQ